MIHWAQAAKLRISPMTSTTPIEWSIQSLEYGNQGLEEGNQGLKDGNQSLEYRNHMTDNVKLLIQIQTSEVEQLRREVAKYRRNKVPKNDEKIHSAKDTNNYDEDDDHDKQIHSAKKQNNYDEDADIDNMILLFKVLMAALVFLLMFVGGIVGWEIHKSNRVPTQCIDEVIGDGLCDDRQNIAECRYDGNDCCLGQKNTTFCEDCACHSGKCSDCKSKKQVIKRLCFLLQIPLPQQPLQPRSLQIHLATKSTTLVK
jgi:hypothetical protein